MNTKEEISKLIYKNSIDTGDGVLIDYKEIHNLIGKIDALFSLHGVVKSLPNKELMNFDAWLEFLKWEQVGNSYVYKQGNRYKDANELKQIHNTYLNI